MLARMIAALLVCAAFSAHPADSVPERDLTDLPLEVLMQYEIPTVYSASRFEQKTTEAPASVSIVGADEVKRYGYRTLADLLRSVQGLHVSDDRNYAFLGARGVNLGDFNGRILLLVDGHRVNNNLTDGAFIDTAFILDIDLIERVEIIRGPGSVLYGNNAFFGVINVVTRQGAPINGMEFSGEYASFDTYKTRITIGKQFTNGVQMVLSGTIYDSEGPRRLFFPEFNTPEDNDGVAVGLDDDSFKSAFGSLSYGDFTLQGAFISRDKGNPTAQFFTTFNDPRLRTLDERSYVNLKYAHDFEGAAELVAKIYYDRNDFEIGYPIAGTFSREQAVGEWWGAELQLNRRLWERHILTVGAEYRDDFRIDRQITGQPLFERDRQSHGVYTQLDFAVRTNLHFHGGVRYDQYGDFEAAFSPRLALIYDPFEKTTLKAIYGTAFRAPNFLELSLAADRRLRPEEIATYELIVEQGLGRYLRGSISGFYNRMEDVLMFESGAFQNFDLDAKGIELGMEGIWPAGVRTRASYTLQTTDKRSSPLELPDSPQHLFKFNLSVPIVREKVFAGLEYQYTGDRRTLRTLSDPDGQLLTVHGATASDFGIVNLTLFSQNLIKNVDFSASIYNLLDEKYADPATRFHRQEIIESDGRTFRVKLTCRF